jgi:hypothetical protein
MRSRCSTRASSSIWSVSRTSVISLRTSPNLSRTAPSSIRRGQQAVQHCQGDLDENGAIYDKHAVALEPVNEPWRLRRLGDLGRAEMGVVNEMH